MKNKIPYLFLGICTLLLLITLIVYTPSEASELIEPDLSVAEVGSDISEYLLLESYGFECVHVFRHEEYAVIEVTTANYYDLYRRLGEAVDALSALSKYGDDIRVWVVAPGNREEVRFTYENGKLESFID